MSDIKLKCISDSGSPALFDISQDGAGLEIDDGLETAVVISLFTDRRAEDDDELPGGDDRRGWWGDTYAEVEGDLIGSRLWLLDREKQVASTLVKAKQYAEEALQWMIEDGIEESITVSAEVVETGALGLRVEIKRPGHAPVKFQFNDVWEAV